MTDQHAGPYDPPPRPAVTHAAALVRSPDDLLAEASLFVKAGLEADELVVVAGSPAFQQRLAEQFGDAEGVEFDDGIRLNTRRPPDALGHGIRLSGRAAGRGSGRLRLLAEVDYGSDPRHIQDVACFESAVNLAPFAAPTTALCVYDTSRLSPDLVGTVPCTHPSIVEAGRVHTSDNFVEPREFVRGLGLPDEPLQRAAPRLAIDDAPTLAGLRHALGDELKLAARDRDQQEDLHLAVSEMAANAFRHGRRPVSARLWAASDRLVCTISDGGRGMDPLHGYWPAHGEDLGRGGMGLWLARKLCDHVDLSTDDHGTTVRLATALR